MEKKSGIVATREGLFIPARYFRQMADSLEIVLSPGEISIRSSLKERQKAQRRSGKHKTADKKLRA
jgi:hypothetical protein